MSVFIFQGFFMFLNLIAALNNKYIYDYQILVSGLAISFMIGGVYPLTQIYQHNQDRLSGDKTLSILLGYRGTFVFSLCCFLLCGCCLFLVLQTRDFLLFQLFLFPVAYFFLNWFKRVWKNNEHANFDNTMKMNTISSICMNGFFIYLAFKNLWLL